jgi:hypothetical protein
MARYSTNPEGLTFEEWVGAAGALTKWGDRVVLPWTNPGRYSSHPYPAWVRTSWKEGVDPTDLRPYMDHELRKWDEKRRLQQEKRKAEQAARRLDGSHVPHHLDWIGPAT